MGGGAARISWTHIPAPRRGFPPLPQYLGPGRGGVGAQDGALGVAVGQGDGDGDADGGDEILEAGLGGVGRPISGEAPPPPPLRAGGWHRIFLWG